MQKQMHRPPEVTRDLFASSGTDSLQAPAALPDYDCFLAVALDDYLLADHGRSIWPVLPSLGLDRRGIGQLFVQLVDDLLARELRCDHAVCGVRDFVFGVEPRTFAHRVGKRLPEVGHAIA